MALWFWRKKQGRHALGAAVTSIPSAPAQPVAAAAVPAAVPVVAPGQQPDLLASIAQLIATGEAWAEPGQTRTRVQAASQPVAAAPAAPGSPEPSEPVLPTLQAEPIAPLVLSQPAPPSTLPRVQLGFRDGSSTSLDPDSQQSRALEQLAWSLTRRD